MQRLVRAFYAAARTDPMPGPLFERMRDREAHIANITAFWSSVALLTGRYHGHPFAAHLPLDLRKPRFTRWRLHRTVAGRGPLQIRRCFAGLATRGERPATPAAP